jgi:hypothetical protein
MPWFVFLVKHGFAKGIGKNQRAVSAPEAIATAFSSQKARGTKTKRSRFCAVKSYPVATASGSDAG